MSFAWIGRLGLILAACCLVTSASAKDKLWTVDFEEAKLTATKDQKDIFMEFTGSDWCPPCMALHENVFTKEEFQTEATKSFVLLKLDNPRDKSKQPQKEQEQYQALSKLHKITGVPTMILADKTGKPYAKFVGYGGETATAFTQKITDATQLRKTRDEYFGKAAKARGIAKARLLSQGLEGMESEIVLAYYGDEVNEIIKLDDKDEAGLKSKYEGLVKSVELRKQLETIQQTARRDPPGALKQIDSLISENKLQGELLQEALFTKGAILFPTDKAASKQALEESLAAAPESKKAAQIKTSLERAFKDMSETPKPEKKNENK